MLSLFRKSQSSSRAFTLLELIVVIVILGILAAIAIPTFQKVIAKSQTKSAEQTLAAIAREAAALAAFRADGTIQQEDVDGAVSDMSAAAPGVYAATAYTVVSTYSLEYGVISSAISVDGTKAGLAMKTEAGGCAFALVDVSGSVEEWSYTQDLGMNCSGTVALDGASGTAPVYAAPPPPPGGWALSVGADVTCVSKEDRKTGCWGQNVGGQLGDGTALKIFAPRVVVGDPSFTKVSSGGTGNHTCAVRSDGGVWCWGSNGSGQHGNPAQKGDVSTPQQMLASAGVPFTGATDVATGGNFTCVLKTDETVWCVGQNNTAQVNGKGTSSADVTYPVQVAGVGGTGTLAGVKSLATGTNHVCAGRSSDVVCWGSNAYGQLGTGVTSTQAAVSVVVGVGGTGTLPGSTSVTAGLYLSCAASGGNAYCWGYNPYKQLGNGLTANSASPVAVLTPDGLSTLAADGVTAGVFHACATQAGKAFCWGYYPHGQLANGSTAATTYPTAVKFSSGVEATGIVKMTASQTNTCAYLGDGTAWCAGSNSDGQLGVGVPNAYPSLAQVVGPAGGVLQGVTSIHTNTATVSCAVASGKAYCWGQDNYGRAAQGRIANALSPQVSLTANLRSSAAGGNHVCGIDGATNVLCWGYNSNGALGDGTYAPNTTPKAVRQVGSTTPGLTGAKKIVATSDRSCGLIDNGQVACWGVSSNGSGGTGSTGGTSHTTPYWVKNSTNTGPLTDVRDVETGRDVTCFVVGDAGNVLCTGKNNYGQVGNNDSLKANVGLPTQVVNADGTPFTGARSVGVGGNTTCAVKTDDSVWCWGYNNNNLLGQGADMTTTSIAMTPTQVKGVGGAGTLSAERVELTEWTACALLPDATAACWGQSPGTGAGSANVPSLVGGSSPLANVVSIGVRVDAGAGACVANSAAKIFCWGGGRIGNGTENSSFTPIEVDVTGL